MERIEGRKEVDKRGELVMGKRREEMKMKKKKYCGRDREDGGEWKKWRR